MTPGQARAVPVDLVAVLNCLSVQAVPTLARNGRRRCRDPYPATRFAAPRVRLHPSQRPTPVVPFSMGELKERFKLLRHRRAKRQCVSAEQPTSVSLPPSTEPINDQHASMDLTASLYTYALKLRLITWSALTLLRALDQKGSNCTDMHDSVPVGDLSELLGTLPEKEDLPSTPADKSLPRLPLDTGHPYHLIVVAAQECASGNRWLNRLTQILTEGRSAAADEPPSPVVTSHEAVEEPAAHPLSRSHPSGLSKKEPKRGGSGSAGDGEGPYLHVETSRLMGIAISVFALRSASRALLSSDKGKLAVGVANVVGNKGCAAVSVDIAGLRLLFMSSHLAAHQTELAHRERDFARISRELVISDFTARSDSVINVPVPHRFDLAFLLGDLNFRLELSRLHADWLCRQKDWTNALTFDQLTPLRANPASSFFGWSEHDIKHAPTYKYDVLKLEKRRSLRPLKERGRASSSAVSEEGQPIRRSRSANSRLLTRTPLIDSVTVGPATATVPPGSATQPATPALTPHHSFSSSRPRANTRPLSEGDDPILAALHSKGVVPEALERARANILATLRAEGVDDIASTNASTVSLAQPVTPRESTTDATVAEPVAQIVEINGKPVTISEAVFDSSRKQRVQSWTDRILWRSTMTITELPEPPPPPAAALVKAVSKEPPTAPDKRRASLAGLVRFVNPTTPRTGNHGRRASEATIRFEPEKDRSPPRRASQFYHKESPRSTTMPSRYQASIREGSEADDVIATLRRPSESPPALRIRLPDPSPPTRMWNESIFGGPESPSSAARAGLGLSLFRTLTLRPSRTNDDGRESPLTSGSRRPSGVAASARSWWSTHMPAFLTSFTQPDGDDGPGGADGIVTPPRPRFGPRPGEVLCLSYDSVNDLARMQAMSDHRPVVAVFAVGIS